MASRARQNRFASRIWHAGRSLETTELDRYEMHAALNRKS